MDQMEQRPMTYYNLDTEFHCPQCDALVSPDAYQCDQCGALFQEGTYACQNCGAQVSPEMLECPECGEIFSQNPTLCPKCGGAVREDARSCDKCGEEFWSPIRPPMEVERGKAKAQPTGSPEMLGNEDFEELPERI